MSDYKYNELDTEGAILEKRISELEGADPEQSKKLLEQYEKEDKLSKSIEEDTPRDDNWLDDTINLLDNKSKQGDASKNVTGGRQTTLFNKPIPKVYGSGKPTYGIISNKDPNWDAKVKAKENRRNAIRAGMDAANAKREELLGTGKYYDDGSGNLRLKKKYAVIGGRRGRREYDFGQEKAQYEIQQAGQKAYDAAYDGMDFNSVIRRQQVEKAQRGKAKTNQLVELNKAEMEERKKLKAEREVRNAKQDLAIYDGLVVAFKSLDDDGEEAQQVLKESPYDFKTQTKDSQGRVIGVGGEKKQLAYAADDGYRMQDIKDANGKVIGKRKFGIVGVKAIDEINKKLAEQGNKQYKVTAIVAQQKIDAIGNKSGEPVFYVQRLFADGTQRADTLTMKEIYQLGLKGYKTTGVAEKDAENNVIDSLGDIMGTRKRQTEALIRDPKYRKSVLDAEKAKIEVAKVGFDMRTSQINNLMAQRKALVDEGAPGSEEAIATIDKKIAMLNEMNGAATGVNEFARALGVTGVGIGGGKPITKEGYEIASEFETEGGRTLDGFTEVVSNGKKVRQVQYLPKSGEYLVNTEEAQPDGSYSFRVSKGKQHLGSEYVTFVGEDGRVRQRKRMGDEGATEQHDDGLFVNVQRHDGQFVRIFVPVGKVIKTPFGNKRVSGEKGGYQLRDTYKQPDWSAREGILAEWEKSNPAKTEERKELSTKKLIELGRRIYSKKNNSENYITPMGVEIEPRVEELIAIAKKELNKRRSRANWGKRRRGGTGAVQKANQKLDEVVAEAAGISVDEAKKIREEKENREFDTKLTPEEEIRYQQWRRTLPKSLQYGGDYDLRGYWKDPETKKEAVEGDHFIDKYKKPNHPTFSNESKYAVGRNAEKAGHWSDGVYIPPKK